MLSPRNGKENYFEVGIVILLRNEKTLGNSQFYDY